MCIANVETCMSNETKRSRASAINFVLINGVASGGEGGNTTPQYL